MIFQKRVAIIAPLYGDVPKRLKGADSKSARRRKVCGGSNPSISATKKTTFVYQTNVVFFELSVPLAR